MAESGADRSRHIEDADRQLRRELGFWEIFFLSLGAIIGSGWLFAALSGAALAGPAALMSWVIAVVLIVLIGLNYAETACMIPRSGSIVRYPHMTHGGFLGFIISWVTLLGTVTVTAIESLAVTQYGAPFIQDWTGISLVRTLTTAGGQEVAVLTTVGIVVAIIFMFLFFLVNIFGVKFFGVFNKWVSLWKLVIPVLTALLLLLALQGSNFTEFGGFAPQGYGAVLSAIPTAGILFAFLGFRQGLDFAGEARNPQRDIPAATILSVVVAGAIYFLLQLSLVGALDWGAAGVTPGDWAGLNNSDWASQPLYQALVDNSDAVVFFGFSLLALFGVILLIDAAVSPTGTGWIYMGASSRTFFGMAMHDDMPRWMSRIEERSRVPMLALIASLVIGCIFFLPFPGWYLLVAFITSALGFSFIMGAVQLQVMRRTAPDLPRPFRLPAAWILSPLGFLAGALIFYWAGYNTLKGIVAAMMIGLVLYAFFQGIRRGRISTVTGTALGIGFFVVWIFTQYLGPAPLGAGIIGFFPYWILSTVEVFGFAGLVWLLGNHEAKRDVNAAWWVLFLAMALYLLSYYGQYGILENSVIPFPYDTLVAIAIGLVAYFWSIASGYETDDMKAINDVGTGYLEMEEETERQIG